MSPSPHINKCPLNDSLILCNSLYSNFSISKMNFYSWVCRNRLNVLQQTKITLMFLMPVASGPNQLCEENYISFQYHLQIPPTTHN